MLGRYFAEKNRIFNENFHISGYIRSQCDEPVRRMRYGCKTMDYNGCEVIACYHALLSLGRDRDAYFAEVACTCSRLGLWLGGLWGTRPHALYRFCWQYGLSFRRYRRGAWDTIVENVVLYAYWNPRFRGIHTVELHREAHGFTVTNLGYLYGRYFPTMADCLRAIRTPMPILCLGVSVGDPAEVNEPQREHAAVYPTR